MNNEQKDERFLNYERRLLIMLLKFLEKKTIKKQSIDWELKREIIRIALQYLNSINLYYYWKISHLLIYIGFSLGGVSIIRKIWHIIFVETIESVRIGWVVYENWTKTVKNDLKIYKNEIIIRKF